MGLHHTHTVNAKISSKIAKLLGGRKQRSSQIKDLAATFTPSFPAAAIAKIVIREIFHEGHLIRYNFYQRKFLHLL
jgi:hypothetical protein